MITNNVSLNNNIKNKYICELCYFNTSKLSHYREHLYTIKHQKNVEMVMKLVNKFITKNDDTGSLNAGIPVIQNKFECECGRIYSYKSGLSRHKKICSNNVQLLFNIKNDNIGENLVNSENTEEEIVVKPTFKQFKNFVRLQNISYLWNKLNKKRYLNLNLPTRDDLDKIIVDNTIQLYHNLFINIDIIRNITNTWECNDNSRHIFEII